jgi:hypothetical protein
MSNEEGLHRIIPPNKQFELPVGLTIERTHSLEHLKEVFQSEMGTIGRIVRHNDERWGWDDCVKISRSSVGRNGVQQLAFVNQKEPAVNLKGVVRVAGVGVVPVEELGVPTKEEIEQWFNGDPAWVE